MKQDERFAILKRRFRRLAIVVLSLFFGWYLGYVLAAAFARHLMAYRLFGNVNVALASGVLQFVAVFLLAWRYTRYARTVLDPLAARIVADAEERVGAAVRRRAAGSPVSPYDVAFGDEPPYRPYLGPTPPDGMTTTPDPGATPPDGMAPFLAPTPPDGTASPSSWRGPATRPWTGGTR